MIVNRIDDGLRVFMLYFADAAMASRPPDAVIGPADKPYLHRWHLAPYSDNANCYVHVFYRDDNDRALHDHRYNNVSVVLRGSYLEWEHEHPLRVIGDKYATRSIERRPGDVIIRKASTPHRLSLVDAQPVTSLFYTGEAYREWGFVTPEGWFHWRAFNERIGHVDGKYEGRY